MKVYIEQLAFDKFKYWTKKAKGEVAADLFIEIREGKIVVYDCMLPPQEVSGAAVDYIESKYPAWLLGLGEKRKHLRGQIHSHVNMDISWSGTDKALFDYRTTTWHLFLLINKKNLQQAKIYQKQPFFMDLDVELEILPTTEKAFFQSLDEEFDSFVAESTYDEIDYEQMEWYQAQATPTEIPFPKKTIESNKIIRNEEDLPPRNDYGMEHNTYSIIDFMTEVEKDNELTYYYNKVFPAVPNTKVSYVVLKKAIENVVGLTLSEPMIIQFLGNISDTFTTITGINMHKGRALFKLIKDYRYRI